MMDKYIKTETGMWPAKKGYSGGWYKAEEVDARIEALIAERDRFAERHERHLILGAEVRARAEKAEAERDAARDAALEKAAKVAGADALVQAAEFILDGMGIHAPGYEIEPDDDFLDAANSAWVKDTIARLSTAIRALKGKSQ